MLSFFGTVIFQFAFCLSLKAATPTTVIIDPGHGGIDAGAVASPHREADVTLAVSQTLAKLIKADKRFRVHLTRTRDQALTLEERSDFAVRHKADIFISIHVNSNPSPKAKGAEFYFQNQLPPDEETMLLAHKESSAQDQSELKDPLYPVLKNHNFTPELSTIVTDLLDNNRIAISSQLARALKVKWRGTKKSQLHSIRQAPFFLLTQMPVPSALVELGFITNSEDLKRLINPDHQKIMAEDIYQGLIEYKESMDKVIVTP